MEITKVNTLCPQNIISNHPVERKVSKSIPHKDHHLRKIVNISNIPIEESLFTSITPGITNISNIQTKRRKRNQSINIKQPKKFLIDLDNNSNIIVIDNKKNDKNKKIITMKVSLVRPPINTEAVIPPSKRRFSLNQKNFVITENNNNNCFNNMLTNINDDNIIIEKKRKNSIGINLPKKRLYIKTNEENNNNKINSINNLISLDSKELNESVEEIKKQLDDHWKYQVILLDYNIIDFTSK